MPIDLEEARRQVGAGWHGILEDLYAALPKSVRIVQVKEKFGTLRVYWDMTPNARNPSGDDLIADNFDRLVTTAEQASGVTCEACGREGVTAPTARGWIKTWCASCREANQ